MVCGRAFLPRDVMHVVGHRTQTHLVQPYEPNLFRYLKMNNYTNIMLGKNDMFAQPTFNSSLDYWEDLIGACMNVMPLAHISRRGERQQQLCI